MRTGAFIEQGPSDWEIIQQGNGVATIYLSGSYFHAGEEVVMVYGRVVREDTGTVVVPWTPSDACDAGKWQITLKNVQAGGLYRIETNLSQANQKNLLWAMRGDMRHHIGIGDVYLIAGQSNSAGYGREPVHDVPELGIHLLRNNGRWDLATHPMNESTDTVHPENAEGGNPGHSPYLNFARILKKEMGYPIGLIQTALGGSPLSAWNPAEEGNLYRNLMNIVKNIYRQDAIKGVLWYQGCSDALTDLSDTYLERFEHFVESLRVDLNLKELPFLTVQLNRLTSSATDIMDRNWGKLREAQRQAALQISHVYVVPSLDSMLSDAIHNSSNGNMLIGERLANCALKYIYQKAAFFEAPDLEGADKVDDNVIRLSFRNVSMSLYTFDLPCNQLPFCVEDKDGFATLESYEVGNETITLHLNRPVTDPCFVHGAYEQNPKGQLPMDVASTLPILSFYYIEVQKEAK